jgi:hypothetical protein
MAPMSMVSWRIMKPRLAGEYCYRTSDDIMMYCMVVYLPHSQCSVSLEALATPLDRKAILVSVFAAYLNHSEVVLYK